MQDTRQNETQDAKAASQVFYWPSQDDLSRDVAEWLQAPAVQPYDAFVALAEMRKGRRVIVLWHGPDQPIAAALAGGQGIWAGLADWKRAARGLIIQFRQNRRSMILAEGDVLRFSGLKPLAERLGLDEAPLPGPVTEPLALGHALARLALEQDADLRQLLEDLHSASLPAPDWEAGAVLEQVIDQTAKANLASAARFDHQVTSAHEAAGQATARIAALQGDVAQAEAEIASRIAKAAELTAKLAASEDEAALLRANLDHSQASIRALSDAADAADDLARLRIGALEGELGVQGQEMRVLNRTNADLTDRLGRSVEETTLLRTQLALSQTDLAAQSEAARTTDGLAKLRIGALEGELSVRTRTTEALSARVAAQDADISAATARLADEATALSAAQTDKASLTATLADHEAEANLLRSQLDLDQANLLTQIHTAQKAAEVASLRIAALEAQLAVQGKMEAEIALTQKALNEAKAQLHLANATAAETAGRLADRDAEVDLLRGQIGLVNGDLDHQLAAARVAADVALLRIKALEGQADTVQKGTAAAQAEVARLHKALAAESVKVSEALAEKARLASALTDRGAMADLLSAQVGFLQSGISEAISAPTLAAPVAPDAEGWDKTLAKALAAVRSEADQRAKLQKELDLVRAKLDGQSRSQHDTAFNHKIFAQMTREATAALDEIARLSSAST